MAQRADETNDDHEPDRLMDIDEERDFADQGPLTDMDMEEDTKIRSLLLKHMPSCIDAADIEQLVQDMISYPIPYAKSYMISLNQNHDIIGRNL